MFGVRVVAVVALGFEHDQPASLGLHDEVGVVVQKAIDPEASRQRSAVRSPPAWPIPIITQMRSYYMADFKSIAILRGIVFKKIILVSAEFCDIYYLYYPQSLVFLRFLEEYLRNR